MGHILLVCVIDLHVSYQMVQQFLGSTELIGGCHDGLFSFGHLNLLVLSPLTGSSAARRFRRVRWSAGLGAELIEGHSYFLTLTP